jgi:hypothetical protein
MDTSDILAMEQSHHCAPVRAAGIVEGAVFVPEPTVGELEGLVTHHERRTGKALGELRILLHFLGSVRELQELLRKLEIHLGLVQS